MQLFLSILFIAFFSSCHSEQIGIKPDSRHEPTVTFSLQVPRASIPSTRSISAEDEVAVETIDVVLFKDGIYSSTRMAELTKTSESEGWASKLTFKVTLPKDRYDLVVIANGREIIRENLQKGMDKKSALNSLIYSLGAGSKWQNRKIPMWGQKDDVEIKDNTSITAENAIIMARMISKIEVHLAQGVGGENNELFALKEAHLYNYHTSGTVVPDVEGGGWLEDGENSRALKVHIPKDGGGEYVKKVRGPLSYSTLDDQTNGEYFTKNKITNTIYTFEAEQGALNASEESTCLVIGGSYKGGETTYYRVDFLNTSEELMPLLRNHNYIFSINRISGPGFEDKEDAFKAGPVNIEANVLKWNNADMGDVVFDGQNFLAINPLEITHGRGELTGQKVSIKTDYMLTDRPEVSISASDTDPNVALPESWFKLSGKVDEKRISVGGCEAKEYILDYSIDENTTGSRRWAYLYITIGRLTNIVKVSQQTSYDVSVTFQRLNEEGEWEDINSLHFGQKAKKIAPEAQEFRVLWSPSSSKLTLTTDGATGQHANIVWDTSQGHDEIKGGELTDGSGERVFWVKPEPIMSYTRGSFVGANSKLTAHISVDNDMMARSLDIQQFVEDVWIVPKVKIMDGRDEHYITVKSNVPWELFANRNISDGLNGMGASDVRVVRSIHTVDNLHIMDGEPEDKTVIVYEFGEYNLPNGTNIQLTPVDDIYDKNEIYKGYLGLRMESRSEDIISDNENITFLSGIKQDRREANCYVLDPSSGVGLLIPVQAANGVMIDNLNNFHADASAKGRLYDGNVPIGKKIDGSNPCFGAKLVWADESGSTGRGIEEDGLLSMVRPVGKGEGGHILVLPGSANREGNAVVAVTRNDAEDDADKGDILWSWHIWVTQGMKFKEGNVMKDRILGGFNGTEKSEKNSEGQLDGALWLDRNLGAINNGILVNGSRKSDIYTYGLGYQWGRKDPFPGANKESVGAAGSTNERQLYDASGKIAMTGNHGSISYEGSGTTVPNSIKTPLTYYYNGARNWLASEIDELWGVSQEGSTSHFGKSIFDPCPAGYRVPRNEGMGWNSRDNHTHWGGEEANRAQDMGMNLIIMNVPLGFEWTYHSNYKGGWYPVAGDRHEGGLSTSVGRVGFNWSSEGGTNSNGRHLYFLDRTIIPKSTQKRSLALPVRCVRE